MIIYIIEPFDLRLSNDNLIEMIFYQRHIHYEAFPSPHLTIISICISESHNSLYFYLAHKQGEVLRSKM